VARAVPRTRASADVPLDVVIATERIMQTLAARVVAACFVAVLVLVASRWARLAFDRATARTSADANVRLVTGRLVTGGILALGLVWVLGIMGLDQASILATFGAIGLALGLAVQDILKSFFAGLYLLFERPFLIGDEVQVRDYVGRVEHVGLRATELRTAENVRVVVPNAIVFAEVVSNRTHRTADADSKLREGR